MMNKIKYIIMLYTVICLGACNGDAYLEELYIAPEASFRWKSRNIKYWKWFALPIRVEEPLSLCGLAIQDIVMEYRETPDLQRVVMVYFPIHMMNRVSMRLYG